MTTEAPKFTEEETRQILKHVPHACPHCGAERNYISTIYPAYVSFPCGLGYEWAGVRSVNASPCRRGAPPVYERFIGQCAIPEARS